MAAKSSARAVPRFTLLSIGAKRSLLPVLLIIAGALTWGSTFAVHAALLEGRNIQTTDFHGTAADMTIMIGPVDSVVGSGVELTNFGFSDFVDINFSDTNILITATTEQPFSFFELLRFLDATGTIQNFTSVTINSATNWAGFDASRIFFDADRIDINVTGLVGLQGQRISLDLAGTSIGVISEPPTGFLLGIAVLGMVGLASRRWKKG